MSTVDSHASWRRLDATDQSRIYIGAWAVAVVFFVLVMTGIWTGWPR